MFSSKEQLPKIGCYADGGSETIQLPLKHFSYDVQLADSLAFLQLEQVYYNNTGKILNTQFYFPLNPHAAVVNFEISFGGRTAKGIIKSKEDAEKQFQQNKDENRAVGYGGYHSSNSQDIMRVMIGNIKVGEEVKVKIHYIHTVSLVLNNFYEFRLPTAITPRYASKLSNQQIHFGERFDRHFTGNCNWSLKIKIKSSKQLKAVFSKSHNISGIFQKVTNDTWVVDINVPNMLPNKDFTLCYTFEKFEEPSVLICDSDSSTQALVSFVPKFSKLSLEEAKKLAKQSLEEEVSLSKIKGEYIFLLDRSGSMEGGRIQKAIEALTVFLKSLPQQSYFNIMSFGSRYQLLFDKSEQYTKEKVSEAIEKVNKMDASYGGTQILPPLRQILSQPSIENYPRHVYLLTDGAVENTSDIISYIGSHINHCRIHTIGIGEGCSEDIIRGCSQQGKGYFVFISDSEDPSNKIIDLLDKSLSPIINNLKVSIEPKEIIESIVPNPETAGMILRNEVQNFYFTMKGRLDKPITVKFSYTDCFKKEQSFKLEIDPKKAPICSYLDKMVNFQGLNALSTVLRYGKKVEDHLYYVKEIDHNKLLNKVIEESIKKQILTDKTAFVCVDETQADEYLKSKQKDEKISVNINPMNPVGHLNAMKIVFGSGNQGSESYEQYIDQCCINYYQSDNLNSTLKHLRISKKKIKMTLLNLASNQNYVHQKKRDLSLNLLQIVKLQDPNGMWNQTEQTWAANMKILNTQPIKAVFKDKLSLNPSAHNILLCTLALIEHILTFSKKDDSKMKILLRKAKEYIDDNSLTKFDELDKIWKQYIRS